MTDTTGSPAAGAFEIPPPGSYVIDPDASTVSFRTRHMFGLGPVRGTFRLRNGHIHVAEPAGESSVRATIAATSFATGNSARDSTVRSGTYLDAGSHPDITFASTEVTCADGTWTLRGSLTVRGETRPVDVPVDEAHTSRDAVRIRARSRVDRYEFGITAMKGMTGRYLDFTLDIVATPR